MSLCFYFPFSLLGFCPFEPSLNGISSFNLSKDYSVFKAAISIKHIVKLFEGNGEFHGHYHDVLLSNPLVTWGVNSKHVNK